MRAFAKTVPGVGAQMIDAAVPAVCAGEVLVQVAACGICGSDLSIYDWTASGRAKRGKPVELPRILGHEASGVVVAVGDGVVRFSSGDRVAADTWGGCGQCRYCRSGRSNLCEPSLKIGALRDGALAEYVLVPEVSLRKLPEDMSFSVGALMEPLSVAVHTVERSVELRPGSLCAVLGPGPLGLLVALVARASGAHVIVGGLARDGWRLDLAKRLGFATFVVDADVVRAATELLGGQHPGVVFDVAGDLPTGVELAARGGEVVVNGFPAGPVTVDLLQAMWKELSITTTIAQNPISWERSFNLVTRKTIDVESIISHRFALEDCAQAFELLRRGEGAKIVIAPDLELLE